LGSKTYSWLCVSTGGQRDHCSVVSSLCLTSIYKHIYVKLKRLGCGSSGRKFCDIGLKPIIPNADLMFLAGAVCQIFS
jgi:hypothetical protein